MVKLHWINNERTTTLKVLKAIHFCPLKMKSCSLGLLNVCSRGEGRWKSHWPFHTHSIAYHITCPESLREGWRILLKDKNLKGELTKNQLSRKAGTLVKTRNRVLVVEHNPMLVTALVALYILMCFKIWKPAFCCLQCLGSVPYCLRKIFWRSRESCKGIFY